MAQQIGTDLAAILLHPKDNVVTALRDVAEGDVVLVGGEGTSHQKLKLLEDIQFGHKIALQPIPKGALVYKYGEVIGRSTADIPAGGHVHVHNVESIRGRGDLVGGKAGA